MREFAKAAGIDAADVHGATLLHYAVREGKVDAARLLMEMGASKEARNISGETAADIAKAKGDGAMKALFGM
ncbi:MAG: hypothetical protein CVV53_04430 [Spirochaetae bacterium HGW-Spirochaetae-9]|nr:MAG: hypothetical protein CVV53_04430 [Spirochaetae bacterium HGW-Spirochaetae-9]